MKVEFSTDKDIVKITDERGTIARFDGEDIGVLIEALRSGNDFDSAKVVAKKVEVEEEVEAPAEEMPKKKVKAKSGAKKA